MSPYSLYIKLSFCLSVYALKTSKMIPKSAGPVLIGHTPLIRKFPQSGKVQYEISHNSEVLLVAVVSMPRVAWISLWMVRQFTVSTLDISTNELTTPCCIYYSEGTMLNGRWDVSCAHLSLVTTAASIQLGMARYGLSLCKQLTHFNCHYMYTLYGRYVNVSYIVIVICSYIRYVMNSWPKTLNIQH